MTLNEYRNLLRICLASVDRLEDGGNAVNDIRAHLTTLIEHVETLTPAIACDGVEYRQFDGLI
jgi:hypothetical protein